MIVNLNAEETKSALECCSGEISTRENCSVCPMGGKRDCMTVLYRNSLSIIKHYEDKIFALENRLEECENGYEGTLHLESCKLHDAEEKVKELTQANEQLSESYDNLEKSKDELLAERSRLILENERLRKSYTDYEETTGLKKVREETVRKMQEMSKKELRSGNAIMDKSISDIIDKIAKEMLEGNNENQ